MPVISVRMPLNAVMKGEFDMRRFQKSMLFRKLILLLLALGLLASMLAGCQTESSYEPLTEEKIKEIRTAWETATNPPFGSRDYHYRLDFTSPDHYYGTHGDCIALFYGSRDADAEMLYDILVADSCFHSSLNAPMLYIYRDGEFKLITVAYEDGWLTKEQVASMAEHHKTTNNYCNCRDDKG